jgi:hypothetical protein
MPPSRRPPPLEGKKVILGALALVVFITASVVTVALVTQRRSTSVAPTAPAAVVAPATPGGGNRGAQQFRWSQPVR